MEAMALSAFSNMYEFPYVPPYLVILYLLIHSVSSIQLTCTQLLLCT